MDIVFVGSVFIAGLLSFFTPCVLPLLPVYAGILMDEEGNRKITIGRYKIAVYPIVKTLVFLAGIATVFFLLGSAASVIGQLTFHPMTHYVLGIIIILLGIHHMELIQIRSLERTKTVEFRTKKQNDLWKAYLLGLSFSFGWTPCIGPVLGSIIAIIASQSGSMLYGGLLLLVYTIGLAIPFLAVACTSSLAMNYFQKVKKHMLLLKRIGGALIVGMGVFIIIFG